MNIRTLKPSARIAFGLVAVFWAGLTFWLSSSPDAQGVGGFLNLSPPWDKFYHAGNFGVLAGLLYLASGRAWLAILLASVYGASDELHQAYVPGRSSDVLDWLADTAGATISVLLLYLFLRLRQRRKA